MNLNPFAKPVYEVRTKCKNCKFKQATKIKKGNKVEEVLDRGVCQNCGCQELELIQ